MGGWAENANRHSQVFREAPARFERTRRSTTEMLTAIHAKGSTLQQTHQHTDTSWTRSNKPVQTSHYAILEHYIKKTVKHRSPSRHRDNTTAPMDKTRESSNEGSNTQPTTSRNLNDNTMRHDVSATRQSASPYFYPARDGGLLQSR